MTLKRYLVRQGLFLFGWLFYLGYSSYALRYSRWRDRIEKRFAPPPPPPTPETPGKLLKAESTPRGATFFFERAELEVTFLVSDLVRLDWKPGIPPLPYGIARSEWESIESQLKETPGGWTVGSGSLQVEVDSQGGVRLLDARGAVLREELPPQRQGEQWTHRAKLRQEERIYGLGERIMPLNLRLAREVTEKGEITDQPKSFRMWNYDAAGKYGTSSDPLYICIPVYLGLHHQGSYLTFYENSWDAQFKFTDEATAQFEGGALRYYLSAGTPAQLLERYTELTGRSPLPPRWALGYHQSRWGYRTETALREVVDTFRENDLPLSAVHMDIDVQVGFRAFTIDPKRFPKISRFIQELAGEGVQFITILNPGIKYSRASNLFLEGQLLDVFCKAPDGKLVVAPVWPGWTVFPDFTNPTVRRWWSRQYEYLLDVGVAGFWHDMNEPAAFIAWGDRSLPKVTQHFMEGRGGDHREAHNVYGLLQAIAAYDSLCYHRPNQRPFIVSRAGWAGLQRYAWTWTGDVECTWEAMRQTIPTVLGLGLSGIPYSGPDIGGFQGNPPAELYLRWFQMASFFTFCRTHSSNNVEHRNPWTYGEPTLSIIRDFLKLRYRLLPYFYTLAWETSQTGHPIVRPLFWADPQDDHLWDIDDQFLLGDSLLICPISQAGQRSRTVVLPQGQWFDFWSDRSIEGGTTISLEAPLERIPVLVKAGTVLPMEQGQRLTLHLYPPTEGGCEMEFYSDAGDGYAPCRRDYFFLQRHPEGVEITRKSDGDYTLPYAEFEIQIHGEPVEQVWADGLERDWVNNAVVLPDFQQAYFRVGNSRES